MSVLLATLKAGEVIYGTHRPHNFCTVEIHGFSANFAGWFRRHQPERASCANRAQRQRRSQSPELRNHQLDLSQEVCCALTLRPRQADELVNQLVRVVREVSQEKQIGIDWLCCHVRSLLPESPFSTRDWTL